MKDFKNLAAYELVSSEKIDDLKAEGYFFRHKKSGARVAFISNDDENKVFCVGFRTPPTDSTGVAHIIEHTVLCGSDKYPLKDPFMELVKGSLNTFINAMTYSDKTIYPVASCNEKDFANLMDVYMDAVLHPNIYKTKNIFMQEGWHYELNSVDDELKYNGVVYSEMKGAFSDPDQVAERYVFNSVFPDTSYGVESGGDPEFIPDLTYENYLDFHRRYYHPVNSYIYIYGNADIEEKLEWLDKEYLSKYDRIELDSSIKKQEFSGKVVEKDFYYPVLEEKEGGAYISESFLFGDNEDLEERIAISVIDQILFQTPGAAVKQALIDAGIGDTLTAGYEKVLQGYFMIMAKNAKKGQKDDFVRVVRETLEKVVKEGINDFTLLSTINGMEFKYKEADYGRFPKGLYAIITAFNSWLYDDNKPFYELHVADCFTSLKKKIGTSYFTDLIKKYFLNCKHVTVVQVLPKAGLNEEREKAMKAKLAAYKNSLSKEEVQKIVDDCKALAAYQTEPSTKEQLETIPLLKLDELKKAADPFFNKEMILGGNKCVLHDIDTNGIVYLQFLFDIKRLPKELVPYVGLFADVLTQLSTSKYTYKELNEQIDAYSGGIHNEIMTHALYSDSEAFNPLFASEVKMTSENAKKAIELFGEVLKNTKFDDSKRMIEILGEIKTRCERRVNSAGDAVSRSRANSFIRANDRFEEMTGGIDYLLFIRDLIKNYDSRKDEIRTSLEDVSKYILNKDNLLVSITCSEKETEAIDKLLIGMFDDVEVKTTDKELKMELKPANEAYITAGQVQFVGESAGYSERGIKFTGTARVLSQILSSDYLWNEIRVHGGAYGANIVISPVSATVAVSSYRDPNLKSTLEAYDNVISYVENFDVDEREMRKYIIGTMSSMDRPLSPSAKGDRALSFYLSGKPYEAVQKEWEEVINTTPEKLSKLADMMRCLSEEGNVVVVGSEKAINENKALFDKIVNLAK